MKDNRMFCVTIAFMFMTILIFGCNKGNEGSTIDYPNIWRDKNTNLCWQNPQREAYNMNDIGLRYDEAVLYCQEISS